MTSAALRPALFLFLLAACSGKAPAPGADSTGTAATEIRGITWVLIGLRGATVVPGGAGPPTLQLGLDNAQAAGFGGCNRLAGSYTLEGSALSFGPLVSTRMACPDVMETEAAFGLALAAVRGWRLNGAELELTAGDSVLATLRRP